MGLLDKALRGQVPATGKAASSAPGGAAFSVSTESLAQLRRELTALAPTADFLLGAYVKIAAALPLPFLGLLWQRAEGLVLAAGRGFAPLERRPVPPGPFEGLRSPFPIDDAFLGLLAPQVGPPPGFALRAQPSFEPEGSVKALWIYGAPGLERADPRFTEALDSVFASTSGRAAPPPTLSSAQGLAGPELLRKGRSQASALLFEFGPFLKEVGTRGIHPSQAFAAIGGAALRILGSSGSAFSPAPARLVVLLYSAQQADAELALAQFRKSLRRALGFLAPAAAAPARALALALDAPGAGGEFDRFLRA